MPAAGWSSWNVFAGRVTAADVMGMADAMVANGLDKLGYIYVAIDCGWNLHTRDAEGNLQPDPNKFPDGIAAVAKYVNGLGDGRLKLGEPIAIERWKSLIGFESCIIALK